MCQPKQFGQWQGFGSDQSVSAGVEIGLRRNSAHLGLGVWCVRRVQKAKWPPRTSTSTTQKVARPHVHARRPCPFQHSGSEHFARVQQQMHPLFPFHHLHRCWDAVVLIVSELSFAVQPAFLSWLRRLPAVAAATATAFQAASNAWRADPFWLPSPIPFEFEHKKLIILQGCVSLDNIGWVKPESSSTHGF